MSYFPERRLVADSVPFQLVKCHTNKRFGGRGADKCLNDTWVFNAVDTVWEELAVTGPIPVRRHGHAACIIDRYMYVFGGQTWTGRLLDDFCAFNTDSTFSPLSLYY